jgi:hypothetical protein
MIKEMKAMDNMKIEWSEERGPDADAPDPHRVGIRKDGLIIIDPIWHEPRTLDEIKAGQEIYFRERRN